jgi:hydrogenase/urease accessory protein HupE
MTMAEPDERDATSTAGARHVVALMKVSFDAAPTALRIETDAWGTQASERQLTIKAIRGREAEAAILTPLRQDHQFFRSQWQVLRDYVVVGIEHILFGADHLLFLLTIIVAAAGWRYWFGVLTSFTVAHSMTLALSLYGVVRAPSALIEPLIAASIVLVAVLNLRQRETKPGQRIAIVFACGLLHGLGFASSIAGMGLSSAYRLASVVGFNLGIETGQALFLVAVLGIGAIVRAAGRTIGRTPALADVRDRLTMSEMASIVAAVVGAFWFVQRTGIVTVLMAQSVH